MTADTRVVSSVRAECHDRHRRELTAYATRIVLRHEIAEELVQEAALRLLAPPTLPDDDAQIRAWLFRVVTHLAIDHLRRHSTWREYSPIETRDRAEADAAFVEHSAALRGNPEMAAITREHLAVCFACTLRNLPPSQTAALLLREVHGFSVAEAAEALDATVIQVKNWIQRARRTMTDRYRQTCALVTKEGVCYQCVELDHFFNGQRRDPLAGTTRTVADRLAILRELRHAEPGGWHRRLLQIVDAVIGDE